MNKKSIYICKKYFKMLGTSYFMLDRIKEAKKDMNKDNITLNEVELTDSLGPSKNNINVSDIQINNVSNTAAPNYSYNSALPGQ